MQRLGQHARAAILILLVVRAFSGLSRSCGVVAARCITSRQSSSILLRRGCFTYPEHAAAKASLISSAPHPLLVAAARRLARFDRRATGRAVSVASILLSARWCGGMLIPRSSRSVSDPSLGDRRLVAWSCSCRRIATIGCAPVVGSGVMVRPDALADLVAFAGLLLVWRETALALALSVVVLAFAFFVKQSALAFLLAAVVGLASERRGRRATAVVLAVAGLISMGSAWGWWRWGGEFPHALAAELATSKSLESWTNVVRRTVTIAPEVVLLPLALWLCPWPVARRWGPASLVVVAFSMVASAKMGADLNYFLGARLFAAVGLPVLIDPSRSGNKSGIALLGGVLALLIPGIISLNHVADRRQRRAISPEQPIVGNPRDDSMWERHAANPVSAC